MKGECVHDQLSFFSCDNDDTTKHICLDCRGVGKSSFVSMIKDLCRKYDLSNVILLET